VATVDVIVISWNTRELLAECLSSIEASGAGLDIETVVVDNGSLDGSAEMVRTRFPAVRLIANADNRGFAAANNQAIAATDAPYVLMLNSDARLSPDALRTLLARLDAAPRAGVIGAQLRSPSGHFQHSYARFPSFIQETLILSGFGRALRGAWYPSEGPETDRPAAVEGWVGGACMLARRVALEAVGGFDEGYPLYGEETELCYALRRTGWEIWYEPAAVVIHHGGASTKRIADVREARLYRGRLRFFRKHYGRRAARLLAAEIYAFTVPKIVLHGALRAVSGGRIGRRTLSLHALGAALADRDDSIASPLPPRRRGAERQHDRGLIADEMAPLLLATTLPSSGQTSADGLDREHPRLDYIELQPVIGAEVLDYRSYPGGRTGLAIRRLETELRSDPYLALQALARLRHCDQIICMSERVGTPLALLRRLGVYDRHLTVLFQAWSPRQEAAIRRFDVFAHIDVIAVLTSAMRDHLTAIGAPPSRVRVVRWSPDDRFFMPLGPPPSGGRPIALSLGETRLRDYPMLFAAAEGLPLELRVLARGYVGSREKRPASLGAVPSNTSLLPPVSNRRLRELYAEAQFVVLPVYDRLYAAGVTAALEAMCMGRAVIVTRSRGLSDYLRDGESCLLVEPGDVAGLRAAMQRLAGDPELARRLGENGRRRIDAELNQRRFVRDLAALVAGNPAVRSEVRA